MTGRPEWARRVLEIEFSRPDLLDLALTHRSASRTNNERLEFLGDAVLGYCVASMLYESQPDASEGDLSRARAALVNRRTLAAIGRRIGIDDQLQLGAGEISSGGAQRESTLADAVEALIGAVLLDAGMDAAQQLVRLLLEERLRQLPSAEALKDAKTRLQEWLQARGLGLPEYAVDAVAGSDHNQQFKVRCGVSSHNRTVIGSGTSRRRAEQAAAEAMLNELAQGDQ